MKLLICGSRSAPTGLDAVERLGKHLRDLGLESPWPKAVVSGGAQGGDTLGEQYAEAVGLPVERLVPDWKQHGKRAGFLRNLAMLDAIEPDGVVVAVWDGVSRGTRMTIAAARKRGLRVHVLRLDLEAQA